MQYNKITITADKVDYYFDVEEFHAKPIPPNTIMIISRRTHDDASDILPIYHHQYIAVDTGFTSSSFMIHPLNVDIDTFILTCVVEDDDERANVVQHIKDTSESQKNS